MRTSICAVTAAVCALAVSGSVMAHSHNHDDVRHAGAHVHGEGELNFATEGSELHMELMMPAHDVLGFESITTHAQKQQLDDALRKLEADTLWSLSAAAGCQLKEAYANPTKEVHIEDDHGHDHHDHDGHMDIAASYVFQCKDVNRLNQLTTTLFETFPRSERVRVQGFTSSGQLSETMTPNQPQVRF